MIDDLTYLNIDNFPKSKDRIRIIEGELKKLMYPISYHHGEIEWGYFATKIGNAIKNSIKYNFSLEDLKEKSGTNFGLLLKYLEELAGKQLF